MKKPDIYYEIMSNIWSFYHKWILHKGKFEMVDWLICRHINPFLVLTEKKLRQQFEKSKDVEL